ncbi:TonB-dependent receptor [Elongatibacter sediminis]|uniref:TonB-dependent receptor n=1 Tax=Elongatibacter sediminis TaxID=3119006 RepID=UPI00339D6C09
MLAQVEGEASARATEIQGLEEVIITARKQTESLQDVPVSAVVLSESEIDRRNLTSLERIAGSSPELFVARSSNGSGAVITMRGIGSQSTSIGIEQSTAVVVDGVYYGSGFFLNEALFDLDTIEILKGPQALFFGKNATAGVISVTTKSPSEEFELNTRVGYETTAEEVSAEVIVSGPISDTWSGRLALRASDMADGYFDNLAIATPITSFDVATGDLIEHVQQPHGGGMPGTSERTLRGTLLWEPTDRFFANIKATLSSREDDSNAWNMAPVACGNGTGFTQVNPEVPCREEFDVYVPNAPDGFAGALPGMKEDGSSFNDYEAWSLTAILEYALESATITSIFNYNSSQNRWGLGQNVHSPTSFIAATQDSQLDVFSNETRVAWDVSDSVDILVGAYYQNSKRDHDQAAAFAPIEDSSQPGDLRYTSYIKPSTVDGETLSLFGQVKWKIVPDLELAVGARYIHEDNEGFVVQSFVLPALQGLFPQDLPLSADQSFSETTPEVTLTYFLNDNVTLYGGYKSAYKSGGFSASALIVAATTIDDVLFDPETADGFMFGVKSTWLNNQLRVNAEMYRTEYKDLQVDFFNSDTFQFITTNAGKALVEGVEVNVDYAPAQVPGLILNGAVVYNDATYEDFIAPCYTGQSIAAGCNTTFGAGKGQDLSGSPTAVAPKWTSSIGGVYSFDIGSGLELTLGSTIRYSDDYLGSNFGSPLSRQDSYFNVDASVRLSKLDSSWELSLVARNLTNSFHFSSVLDLPNSGTGTGTDSAVPADVIGLVDAPRTFLLQLSNRF